MFPGMGLPLDFKEIHIPVYVLYTLYFIAFFRDRFALLCPYFGLPNFLDHEISRPAPTQHLDEGAEFIPLVRFSDLRVDPEDCCTVCLSEFESDDKIRQLPNCHHVFHSGCLDRWIINCRKMTCPVCRDRIVPDGNSTSN